MSSIGPQLPPHLTKRKRTPDDDDGTPSKTSRTAQNSDDGFGPAAPSNIKNNDEIDLASDSDSDTGPAPAPKPSIGPAQPPRESDSDSDDDYGPALPTAANKPTIGPSLPPTVEESSNQARRDDWMLAPPTAGGYQERDPTKMRARKFASGKGPKSEGVSSMWTETPEEKLQRLRDGVMGRKGGTEKAEAVGKSREEEERNRRIAESIQAQRGKSLMEEHQTQKKGAEEEDDPSKRAFDREKDMALGGQLSGSQKRELINKSANFGSRFSKGSYL